MKLTKTKSGNWAKEETITAGGKWKFCGRFRSPASAEQCAQTQRNKGRRVKIIRTVAESKTAIKKYGEGAEIYRVESYREKKQTVMKHATAAECESEGKTPGPCNA